MAYKVIKSFVDGNYGSFGHNQVIDELPDGVDWLKAGFLEEIEPKKPAKKSPAKKPAKPRTTRKRAAKK